jgi:hypothetical protein
VLHEDDVAHFLAVNGDALIEALTVKQERKPRQPKAPANDANTQAAA